MYDPLNLPNPDVVPVKGKVVVVTKPLKINSKSQNKLKSPPKNINIAEIKNNLNDNNEDLFDFSNKDQNIDNPMILKLKSGIKDMEQNINDVKSDLNNLKDSRINKDST